MPIFNLPIFHTHSAMLRIEADTLEAAIDKFDCGIYQDEQIDYSAFSHPDGPWELDSDGLDDLDNEGEVARC